MTRGQLTEKVDVYSFGVVLMEIITGEINMKRTPSGSLLFLVDRVSYFLIKVYINVAISLICGSKSMKTSFQFILFFPFSCAHVLMISYDIMLQVRCMYKQSQMSKDDQLLLSLVDSRLHDNFDKEQVLRTLKTALLCTLDNPDLRPTTPQAISMLLAIEPIVENDLQPLVILEYSKSLHAVDYGVNESWSDSEARDEPPLLCDLTSRH